MKDGIQKEKRKKKKQDPNLVGQAWNLSIHFIT